MLIKMIMNKLYLECKMRRSILLTIIVFIIPFLYMNTVYSNYKKALEAFEEKDWLKCIKICGDILENEDKCDNLLGIIYLNGYGNEKDYGKAFFYFTKAPVVLKYLSFLPVFLFILFPILEGFPLPSINNKLEISIPTSFFKTPPFGLF